MDYPSAYNLVALSTSLLPSPNILPFRLYATTYWTTYFFPRLSCVCTFPDTFMPRLVFIMEYLSPLPTAQFALTRHHHPSSAVHTCSNSWPNLAYSILGSIWGLASLIMWPCLLWYYPHIVLLPWHPPWHSAYTNDYSLHIYLSAPPDCFVKTRTIFSFFLVIGIS